MTDRLIGLTAEKTPASRTQRLNDFCNRVADQCESLRTDLLVKGLDIQDVIATRAGGMESATLLRMTMLVNVMGGELLADAALRVVGSTATRLAIATGLTTSEKITLCVPLRNRQ